MAGSQPFKAINPYNQGGYEFIDCEGSIQYSRWHLQIKSKSMSNEAWTQTLKWVQDQGNYPNNDQLNKTQAQSASAQTKSYFNLKTWL